MRPSATRFSCRPARYRDGRRMWSCRRTRSGSATTPAASEGSFATASTRPLANLFVHVARVVPPDAEGAARSRSATESFLYRRLETLSETKGRFSVNAPLPIAFDGLGKLEVDLLCAECRVAVELDGAQHLADPVAYRRDRRKDQLLQENGYLVLRFLAEDVGRGPGHGTRCDLEVAGQASGIVVHGPYPHALKGDREVTASGTRGRSTHSLASVPLH